MERGSQNFRGVAINAAYRRKKTLGAIVYVSSLLRRNHWCTCII
jgi:hypothetical protein